LTDSQKSGILIITNEREVDTMKVPKCPHCGSEHTYLFDEESCVSVERETFDFSALFCCDDCGFEKKVFLWGTVNIDNKFFKDTL
jgi:hypothetical protein